MNIIDINGVKREIQSKPIIVTHSRTDVTTVDEFENVDGELVITTKPLKTEVEEKYAEVTITGKVRNWVEWYPLSIFKKMNPKVKL